MLRKICDNLYTIKIRLVGSPLRDLNCYVLRSAERNLLIDTGFNQPECLADLRQGIAELGLDMRETDILATHLHSDHCGLIDKIVMPGRKVYIGEADKALLDAGTDVSSGWRAGRERFRREGFPVEALEEAARTNSARALAADKDVAMIPLTDGQILRIGDIRLQCIHTPGHTPGHMCLYNEQAKFMILGDHVLFDITPNITAWPPLPNTLAHYMRSLRMIRSYDVDIPLPAHRECSCSMTERIDQLLAHHETRLADTLAIVRANPGINGYDVAGRMRWSIRAKDWGRFPLAQKWFAVGEALAHLDYLRAAGDIRQEIRDGLTAYTANTANTTNTANTAKLDFSNPPRQSNAPAAALARKT
ncbi:MAG: MBL fold metallo-hydrolase [Peptococcaceae bacterium]|jgi:glyoxylase-like metal-dependent hydrolase (beta-lactamase superfamily II)|nr:MBL fold metallo-hydrolase [Peptococcaceae bacterium]